MLGYILKKIFGTKAMRDVKRMHPLVSRINEFEEAYQQLSPDQFQAKTQEFKDRIQQGETIEDLMCEAFALVKNA